MKILVATDGSRAGTAAVRFAAKLADDRRSKLVVMTVDSCNGATSRRKSADGRRHARSVLESAARELGRHSKSPARFQVVPAPRSDEIPETISREADRLRVDLVVVGSEGRDTLGEWVVGGTALRLIYVARRPVTVVRAPRRRKPS